CTVFVGGQPGAGKTRATHLVRVSGLHDGPLLPVNGDDLRQYHPDYDRLCDEEPLAMPERTAKASAAWIRMTMEYVDAERIPAIVEGTWRNAATVLDEAANAKRAGRSTHAVVLAVPPVLSRLAMLERYYRDRSVGLSARWTPASAHDNAVANLPATVRAVAMSPLADRLTVIDRDGGVLYDGADPDMFAGQWERGFHRPLSAVETADARMRLARIGSLRSVPGVGTALSDPVVASIRRSLDELA
ncbi:zeta toxin family protein, partial [Parolsenella catena]|uniref:zeta toxin family protein n=1 Tax=Parolsenella catena TaxID=2003188 RepID=UPI003AEF77CF